MAKTFIGLSSVARNGILHAFRITLWDGADQLQDVVVDPEVTLTAGEVAADGLEGFVVASAPTLEWIEDDLDEWLAETDAVIWSRRTAAPLVPLLLECCDALVEVGPPYARLHAQPDGGPDMVLDNEAFRAKFRGGRAALEAQAVHHAWRALDDLELL